MTATGADPRPATDGGHHPAWRLPVLVAATAVALVVLVFAWQARPGPRRPVALFGDSITEMTGPSFERRLGDEFRLVISGVAGARADERIADVGPVVAEHPEQVIVNLGTNDVMQRWDPAQTERSLEAIGTAFGAARCVHLVTVNENIVNFDDEGLHQRSIDVNTRIKALAARHRWRTVPWDAIVRDYDRAGSPEGPLTLDTVHPTDVGQRLLGDAYRQALQSC